MLLYVYIIFLVIFQVQYYFYRRYICAKPHKIITLQEQIREADTNIVKKNSNHLFGLRTFAQKTKIDLRSFTQIIALNHNSITVESNIISSHSSKDMFFLQLIYNRTVKK